MPASSAHTTPIRVRVHASDGGGDRKADGILKLIAEAARPRPLLETLGTMCRLAADVLRADVVSVYVAEDGQDAGAADLVLRANIGFPSSAVGQVRLRAGEGLTGLVLECLRPVSVAVAAEEAGYKHVPGLGEERFPVYLGIPLFVAGTAAGVLVFQRREAHVFAAGDVALATALSAPFGQALERARARAEGPGRAAPSQERSVRLAGVARAGGRALGVAQLMPVLSGRPEALAPEAVPTALAALSRELDRVRRTVEPRLDAEARGRLAVLCLILEDARFRGRVVKAGAELARVAREYARAIYRVPTVEDAGAWMLERTLEIEDLCLLLSVRAAGERLPRAGAIVVGERLSAFTALAALAGRASGFALGGAAEESSLGVAIARAAGLPVVAEVAGLFAWARKDDRLLVDGDSGVVRLNPPASAIARFRRLK